MIECDLIDFKPTLRIIHRELITGRGVDYNKDCMANLDGYVQATTDKVATNNNTPCTHMCIVLGPSGNRQSSFECINLKTGK